MNTIIFSTGSNLGDRLNHLAYAQKELGRIGKINDFSNIYESKAWGNIEQQDFLNQVLVFSTELDAFDCLKILQEIEKERDRTREIHWGPRTLDIDILFFNQEIIYTQKLIIPHPFLEKRLFVLLPLAEILAKYIHPLLNDTVLNILNNCEDKTPVVLYKNK